MDRSSSPASRPEMKLGMAWLTFTAYFLIGTLATLFPSVMPEIIDGFGLSLASAGLVFPANAVGSIVGGLGAGVWSDRVGRKPFVCAGGLLSGLGLVLLSQTRSWPVFVGGFALLGVAQGALSNSINALVMDLNAHRRGAALNGLHGTFSLGAMLSPFLVRLALGPSVAWRPVVLAAALVWVLFGTFALASASPRPAAGVGGSRSPRWSLLRDPLFAMIFAVGFFYNGVSWSLLGWIKVYLRGSGASSEFGVGMISLFYLGLTTGRFACARWSERWTYGRTLVLCGVGAAASYPLIVFGGSYPWIAAGVLLTGLFQSGLCPTGLAYATRLYPTLAGTLTGVMSLAMTAGASLPPWWTGVIGGSSGLQLALRLNGIMLAPLLACCVALMLAEQRARPRPA